MRATKSSDGAPMLAIRVPKTAEVVADQIRKRIIQGDLQEGDFLPPEGQLMDSLSISRPTLREAFRILEAERLISVVRGSRTGARVHLPKVESVARYAGFALQAQGTTVSDIYEARLAIEPYNVRQLAEDHSPDSVQRLRSEVVRLAALVEQERYVDFMVQMAEFHRLLVELGGNKTLLMMTRMLQDVLARYQLHFIQRHMDSTEKQKQISSLGVRSFYKLVDLIEAGDISGAEGHWRLHLQNANKAWLIEPRDQTIIDVLD